MGSLSSINVGLPALPTKLLHRVWANEYINFAELPPARNKQKALPHYLEGRVLLVQMHELDSSNKAIPDLTTWAQCFAVYCAAIQQKQPGRVPDLMAYSFATASNARRYKWPSWVVYDQNFCQLMAENQDLEWAKTNPSLFTQCFIHTQKAQDDWCRVCQSVEHATSYAPTLRLKANQTRRRNLRRAPYAGISQPQRKRLQVRSKTATAGTFALTVGGAHPKFKCPSRKSESPVVPGISQNRTIDRRDRQ